MDIFAGQARSGQGPAARGVKMDTFEARSDHSDTQREHRASKWRRNGRIHREKRPFRHATRPVTLRVTAQRRLEVPEEQICPVRAGKLGKSGRPPHKLGRTGQLDPTIGLQMTRSAQFANPTAGSAQFARDGIARGSAPGGHRAGIGPRQPSPGQPTGTTHADRTYGLAQCADKVAA